METVVAEAIRESYKPDKIKVLFIGESPPAAGTFFYLWDSLTRHTRDAFSNVYGTAVSDSEFLSRFKVNKFYFDDLCLIPVNRMTSSKRNETRHKCVQTLSGRIKVYMPDAIICILISIKKYVLEAVKLAEIPEVPFFVLPYPSRGNQSRYVDKLSSSLRELQNAGIIGKELK